MSQLPDSSRLLGVVHHQNCGRPNLWSSAQSTLCGASLGSRIISSSEIYKCQRLHVQQKLDAAELWLQC